MSVDGIIPRLTASTNVPPYRMIVVSGDMTGSVADGVAAPEQPIVGVSDQSTYVYNNTAYNAISGKPINFQGPFWCQIEAGGAITAGLAVGPDSTGRAINFTTDDFPGQLPTFVACQSALAAGAVVWCARISPTICSVISDGTTIAGNGTTGDPLNAL